MESTQHTIREPSWGGGDQQRLLLVFAFKETPRRGLGKIKQGANCARPLDACGEALAPGP